MTSEFTPMKRKRNPMRYARKSGNFSTVIPKRSEKSQKIGIKRKLEKFRNIE
jgi:hypothetical protein